ncbi:EamA family transporter [Cohnella nanjingensis]|uniref:EamA family transporter n=2 Tax=Cohnella nanjingensis TaxID=1387779 RepID=A0A7X0VER8_9BACL|nr:EamA family transporter [Cohnella nanjingensis]
MTTMQMPVFFSQAASLAVALLALVPILVFRRDVIFKVGKKDLLLLIVQAFLGMFMFRVFMLYGLRAVPAAEAGIVTSLTPAVVVLFSFFLLKERMSRRLAIGVLCSLLGVVSIRAPEWLAAGPSTSTPASYLGLLLVFGAVCGEAMLIILRKMTASHVSSLVGTAYVTFFSFLMFLPFSFVELRRFDVARVDAQGWGMLLYYGLFITLLAYVLWFRGVSKVPAGTAAVYSSYTPVSTLLLSYAILREPFSWAHVIGCGFVLLGVVQVSRNQAGSGRREKAPRRRREGRSLTDPNDPPSVHTRSRRRV